MHIKHFSMEPLIPDGSLRAFRADVATFYDGKVLLLEAYGETGGNRYAAKRYYSSDHPDPDKQGDARWLHDCVTPCAC